MLLEIPLGWDHHIHVSKWHADMCPELTLSHTDLILLIQKTVWQQSDRLLIKDEAMSTQEVVGERVDPILPFYAWK